MELGSTEGEVLQKVGYWVPITPAKCLPARLGLDSDDALLNTFVGLSSSGNYNGPDDSGGKIIADACGADLGGLDSGLRVGSSNCGVDDSVPALGDLNYVILPETLGCVASTQVSGTFTRSTLESSVPDFQDVNGTVATQPNMTSASLAAEHNNKEKDEELSMGIGGSKVQNGNLECGSTPASVGPSTPVDKEQKHNPKKRQNPKFDLNVKRKRPRMKKHTPKIFDESKPRKTPKPIKVKPLIPKPIKVKPSAPKPDDAKSSAKAKRGQRRKNSFKISENITEDADVQQPSSNITVTIPEPQVPKSSIPQPETLNHAIPETSPPENNIYHRELEQNVHAGRKHVLRSCRRVLNFNAHTISNGGEEDLGDQITHGNNRIGTNSYEDVDLRAVDLSIKNAAKSNQSLDMNLGSLEIDEIIDDTHDNRLKVDMHDERLDICDTSTILKDKLEAESTLQLDRGIGAVIYENGLGAPNQTRRDHTFWKVYRRPSICLRASRKLGPSFPKICKKGRTKRRRCLVFYNFLHAADNADKGQMNTQMSCKETVNAKRIAKGTRKRGSSSRFTKRQKHNEVSKTHSASLSPVVKSRSQRSKLYTQNIKSAFREEKFDPEAIKSALAPFPLVIPKMKRSKGSQKRKMFEPCCVDEQSTSLVDSLCHIRESTEDKKIEVNVEVQDVDTKDKQIEVNVEVQDVDNKDKKVEVNVEVQDVDNKDKKIEVNEHSSEKESEKPGVQNCGENVRPMTDGHLIKKPGALNCGEDIRPMTDGSHELKALVELLNQKLECLRISDVYGQIVLQNQNMCGPIVSYKGKSEPLKKSKPARVDLDPLTMQMWKQVMENDESKVPEGVDKENEDRWKEQRKIFVGRVDSFINRMHLILGNRRFTQWKGSVVDSIVGVFLTQNVSDHLSSSAFMSLVSKFPLLSTTDYSGGDVERVCSEDSATNNGGNGQASEGHSNRCKQGTIDHLAENQGQNVERVCSGESATNTGGNGQASDGDSKSSCAFQSKQGTTVQLAEDLGQTSVSLMGEGRPDSLEDDIAVDKNDPCFASSSPRNPMSTNRSSTDGDSNQSCVFQFKQGTTNQLTENLGQTIERVCSGESATSTGGNGQASEGVINESRVFQSKQGTADHLAEDLGKNLVFLMEQGRPDSLEDNIAANKNAPGFASASPRDPISPNISSTDESYYLNDRNTSGCSPASYSHCPKTLSSDYDVGELRQMGDKFEIVLDDLQEITNIGSEDTCGGAVMLEEVDTSRVKETESVHSCASPGMVHSSCSSEEAITVESNSLGNNATILPKTKSRKKGELPEMPESNIDWDKLRKNYSTGKCSGTSESNRDSADWEAVRCVDVKKIADAIKMRGMNNILAAKIQAFLNRVVEDHGSIDLEWLRDVPQDKVKEYLLSIDGLGLKSVECVRLLSLRHLAFPVDTNVGRVAVRLGWVPLQPLPDGVQMHLLEKFPMLDAIQKYLWPRLCDIDPMKLYELHYQMITFGKVFCTKRKPNCNVCPLRAECRHFASAFASARLRLPGPQEKGVVASKHPVQADRVPDMCRLPPTSSFSSERFSEYSNQTQACEPIVEMPPSPEHEPVASLERDIEDFPYDLEDEDEIPTIKLNAEEFRQNVLNFIDKTNAEELRESVLNFVDEMSASLREEEVSKALVILTPEAASASHPKLKHVNRLRTEHRVYQLPDGHPLLTGFERRELDDPCPYLLAIWPSENLKNPGNSSTSQDSEPRDTDKHSSSSASQDQDDQTVSGTILIPCRTANRGRFPLNGTYFQVNEVFADHLTSLNPIRVPRSLIWNLERRTLLCGTSATSIFRDLSTPEIQYCFWRGFMCVRGYDRDQRVPRPLGKRFHAVAKNKDDDE